MPKQKFRGKPQPHAFAGEQTPESFVADLRREAARFKTMARLRARQMADALHELRSPLLAVSGYAKLLLREQAGEINPTQREYLTAIRENAAKMIQVLQRATRLIDDDEPGPRTIDLRELWWEAAATIRTDASGQAVWLDARLPLEPCLVCAERESLAPALRKLLSGLVAFGGPGCWIRLEVSRTDEQVTTRISNAGAGSGLAGATATLAPSCWSLSFLREPIEACGGTVAVEDAPAEGCSVRVMLPAARPVTDSKRS